MTATPIEFVIACDQQACREHHIVPADSVRDALDVAAETYEWQVEGEKCYCSLHSDVE